LAEKDASSAAQIVGLKKKTRELEEELDDLRDGSFKIRRELDSQLAKGKNLAEAAIKAEEDRSLAVHSLQTLENERADVEAAVEFYLIAKPKALDGLHDALEMVIKELQEAIEKFTNRLEQRLSSSSYEELDSIEQLSNKDQLESLVDALRNCSKHLECLEVDDSASLSMTFSGFARILAELFYKVDSLVEPSFASMESKDVTKASSPLVNLLKRSRGLVTVLNGGSHRYTSCKKIRTNPS
jgi:hypothetical protein